MPESLFDLVSQDVPIRRAASTGGGEWCGPCPSCGGRDRFRAWPERGRYWCRQCGRRGDALQYLRDFHGLTFAEAKRALGLDTAPPSRAETKRRRTHRVALAAARAAYRSWERRRLIALTDQYRELSTGREVAEIAYRAISRRPDLYSEQERRWVVTLATVYDRLAVLEHELGILTYRQHEAGRFAWWLEEVERERISA